MDTFDIWSLFEYDELRINVRQKDDKRYGELLSQLRLGYVTPDDIDLLNQRKFEFIHRDSSKTIDELCRYLVKLPADSVCLLPTRRMCENLNTAMLRKLQSEEIKLIAKDSFQSNKKLENKINKLLSTNNNSNQCGIDRKITIKIGATIMIRRNIDVTLGLFMSQ
ncbi:hypothetical protein TKK_0015439 [Trichogramma kaykai]